MQFAMDFFARPHQHKGHFTLTLTYASLHWCMFISFVHTTVLFSIETIVKDASKRWWWFFSLHYCTRLLRVVHIIAPLCNRYSSLFVTGSIHLSDRILNVLFHHSIRHSVLHVQTAWHIMKTQLQSLKCITEGELPCMSGRWSTTGTLAPGASRTLPLHSGTLWL